MAEFKVIMNGWKDICNRSDGCINCPIKGCDECYVVLSDLSENAIASIESTVLAETPVWIYFGPHPLGLDYECSVCRGKSSVRTKYCPECGRKMLNK